MPTPNQLGRKARLPKRRRSRAAALVGGPQRKAIVYKIAVMSPRKPNSARITFAKVRIILTNKKIFAKIPGLGEHFLQPHSVGTKRAKAKMEASS